MDTNYFEDELWKTESIENEALEIFHNIHVSINKTRGDRLDWSSPPPSSFSLDSIGKKYERRFHRD